MNTELKYYEREKAVHMKESRVGVLEAAVLLRVAHGGQHERTRLAQVLRLLRRLLGIDIGARRFRRRCRLCALELVLVRGHLFQRGEH